MVLCKKCFLVLIGSFLGLLLYGPTGWAETEDVDLGEARCEALMQHDFLGIQDAPTKITNAKTMAETNKAPAHCEVEGFVTPHVGIKLFMPIKEWNGKFIQIGCGAACGRLDLALLKCTGKIKRGYACIFTDMGHQSKTLYSTDWAYNNLQAEVDFGFRSTHVVTLAGKAITQFFYKRTLDKSYFFGCSTGGRQAMVEAQLFPWDFDGIISGAPAINGNGMDQLWGVTTHLDKNGKSVLTEADLRLVHSAALKSCDMDDGLMDGVISNPNTCDFEPNQLICKNGETTECLNATQLKAVENMYAGVGEAIGQPSLGGGLPIGSEKHWLGFLVGRDGYIPYHRQMYLGDGLRYAAFMPDPGPAYQISDFDFKKDYKRFGMMAALKAGSNPDLRRFKEAGGKLLMFHGVNDQSVLAGNSIDYFEMVQRTMGGHEATSDFFRLFLLPGMGHCEGGDGAHMVDYLSYLEGWVEEGRAPDELLSVHPIKKGVDISEVFGATGPRQDKIKFSRPVFPYPLEARYKGSGSPDQAKNFKPVGRQQ